MAAGLASHTHARTRTHTHRFFAPLEGRSAGYSLSRYGSQVPAVPPNHRAGGRRRASSRHCRSRALTRREARRPCSSTRFMLCVCCCRPAACPPPFFFLFVHSTRPQRTADAPRARASLLGLCSNRDVMFRRGASPSGILRILQMGGRVEIWDPPDRGRSIETMTFD
jgi:hypothetical protein